MNVNIKAEYILFAVIIIVAIVGVLGREWVRNRKVDNLNEQIEILTETVNIQKAKIDEMTARLKTKDTELLAVSRLCTAIEETGAETIQIKEAVHEIIQNDEASAAWANEPVPDSILDALHDILCGTKADHRDKN